MCRTGYAFRQLHLFLFPVLLDPNSDKLDQSESSPTSWYLIALIIVIIGLIGLIVAAAFVYRRILSVSSYDIPLHAKSMDFNIDFDVGSRKKDGSQAANADPLANKSPLDLASLHLLDLDDGDLPNDDDGVEFESSHVFSIE